MVFSSFAFIFGFLPIALIGFWGISRLDHRWSKIWLCLASLLFYSWWDPRWVPVLLTSVMLNYCAGAAIINRANADRPTGLVLLAAATANVGALIYYKYLLWLLQMLGATDLAFADHGLPLGISFFTFTQIAFLVDVSQGFRERYTPTNYLLFVTFFPHLIAGPIVHHRDLMPQFEEERNYYFQPRELAVGLAIFSIGLAKKTLIADAASASVLHLLGGGHVTAYAAWVGVLSYSMQLYFDFSGYSDMAIGLARLFGIKFPINFDSPYKATSIIEFWQRWHITLTRFLTAYVYNPIALMLVRRRVAAGRSSSKRTSRTLEGFLEMIVLPTMITMLIAGIWHGAGMQFVIFGALHGFYISANHAWRTFGPSAEKFAAIPRRVRSLGYAGIVYLCVLVAQIFFWANSTSTAIGVLDDMFLLRTAAPTAGIDGPVSVTPLDLACLLGSAAIVWLAPNTQQIMVAFEPALSLGRSFKGAHMTARLSVSWALGFGFVFFLGLLNIRSGQPFIYFNF